MRGLAITIALWAWLTPLAASAQAAPPEGAWLRYRFEQRLVDGTGAYEGYEEVIVANARYDIVSIASGVVTFRGRYAWSLAASDRTDSGTEDRTVSFSLSDRLYREARTDVSDYDEQDGRTLAVWLWIPPRTPQTQPVRILERELRITSTGMPSTIAGAPRDAITLVGSVEGSRDDAYGHLRTNVTDRYWYDAATGMFLREVVEERANGTLDGEPAGFRLVTTIELVDSSYAPGVNPPSEPSYTFPPATPPIASRDSGGDPLAQCVCWSFMGLVVLGGIFAFLIIRRSKRRRGPTETASGERFDVKSLAAGVLPPTALGSLFDPFLPHMVRVARAAKHPVAVATGAGGSVLGVAIGDREAAVGTIFAPDSDVCEALRREIQQTEFFSDVRHPTLASIKKLNLSAPAEAYNIYETYELMQLSERPGDLGYDTDVIGRMKQEHRAAVVALLDGVYGVPCAGWLDASIEQGDVAWIAEDAGRVVGFAMATVVDTRARLHSLTVHPDARNRGLGTALYRARLRALFDLGVETVITECATWNVAALELARAHGFVKAGVMYVESSRHQRDERKFLRR